MKLIMIIIMVILLSIPIAYSKPSDESINYLTNIVYQDCQNEDLNIKDGFILNTQTNKTVTLIKWPYSNYTVRRMIELLGNYEPYDLYNGGASMSMGSQDGRGILKCGSHILDINQFTYFWDSVRVDLPKEEILQTYGDNSPIVKNNGNNNKIATGQNNQISEIDLFSFSLGSISVGSIGLGLYFLIRRRKSNKS